MKPFDVCLLIIKLLYAPCNVELLLDVVEASDCMLGKSLVRFLTMGVTTDDPLRVLVSELIPATVRVGR